jgi:hypothetical protein
MSERDDYRKKIESLVANWNTEFDELEARIRTNDAEPMDDYDDVISELRQYRYMAMGNH